MNDAAASLAEVLARRVTVLGATGTVGKATVDVVAHARSIHGPDSFPVQALTAQRNVEELAAQALKIKPRIAVIGDPSLYGALKSALAGNNIRAAAGPEALVEAAQEPAELVMAAIVGMAGLSPTLAAVERGALVTLANKECIVAAGAVFQDALARSGSRLIPVDSEHNAAFQLLDFSNRAAIEKLVLTASGGPFRTWSTDRMASVTPEQAINHPNWFMGSKISVDSATLMNKGLELIEAHILFGLDPGQLDTVIHAQSIVHCLVHYCDGSQLAHLSAPDMRVPIAYSLGWPRRLSSPARRLDLTQMSQLTFEPPDLTRFPCLKLAKDCLQLGGAAPTILNAANEVAVESFLMRRIGFLEIGKAVEDTLASLERETHGRAPTTLDEVQMLDNVARRRAGEICRATAA